MVQHFVIVPKPNGTVQMCLDSVKLDQALIWPIHVTPTLNDILPTLTNVYHMMIIDASSGYQSLKLDENPHI